MKREESLTENQPNGGKKFYVLISTAAPAAFINFNRLCRLFLSISAVAEHSVVRVVRFQFFFRRLSFFSLHLLHLQSDPPVLISLKLVAVNYSTFNRFIYFKEEYACAFFSSPFSIYVTLHCFTLNAEEFFSLQLLFTGTDVHTTTALMFLIEIMVIVVRQFCGEDPIQDVFCFVS